MCTRSLTRSISLLLELELPPDPGAVHATMQSLTQTVMGHQNEPQDLRDFRGRMPSDRYLCGHLFPSEMSSKVVALCDRENEASRKKIADRLQAHLIEAAVGGHRSSSPRR